MSERLHCGDSVRPYGKVVAVMVTGGERYYMLMDKHKTVSLMPSDVVERLSKKRAGAK